MQKIIMTYGLPASGKSTWAKQFVKDNPNWIRVNADDIRLHLNEPFSTAREKKVFEIEDAEILDALYLGQNIVVDDTNLSSKQPIRIKEVVKEFGQPVSIELKRFIDVSLPELIERDSKRGDSSVGRGVILRMWKQYMQDDKRNQYNIENMDKKIAYIVDIDGTLAEFGMASPYDRDFSLDMGNQEVIHMLQIIKGFHGDNVEILVTSGRKSQFRKVTEKWLFDEGVPYDALFMRPDGDERKDYIVKKELYEKYIKGNYRVMGVFDDRDQVVDGWRDMGLTVFQVNYGNF